ncbi:hypothetical protein Vafri_4358 [Volvox africanus]|uniref:Clathrin adaptor alpha/beta/gamma-adaptin appendage Ig-like subdomain domain-containing protein n=1 Tax=Volvox africanus TaxID=51714 RepID=A0A8J4AUU2_9CHLO|nr:hypothetical protein Vafri_4358 [Volvox africanus]
MPEVMQAARGYQDTVMSILKDPDVSIRRRALDLLFTMCDASSAPQVVSELLKYLVTADFSVREELVLKIAILAEKYAPSMQWYMDVVLQLLERSGDFVSDEIWHRAVQMVTNNPAMQEYAARNVAEALKRGAAHESMVCTAAYVLGEYGRLIRAEVPPAEQFRLLFAAFPAASPPTKGLLMTALLKIYLLDPSNATLSREVRDLFERYKRFMDAELQQRATEYLQALASNPAAAANYILPMPAWTIRESSLMKRLQGEEGAVGAADSGTSSSAADMPSTHASANPAPLLSVPMPSGPGVAPAAADLLSMDSGSIAAGSAAAAAAAPPSNGSATATAAAPPHKGPVDLLSDLFGDIVSTSSAPVAPPPPPPQSAAPPTLSGGFGNVLSAPAAVAGAPAAAVHGAYPGSTPAGFPAMLPPTSALYPPVPFAPAAATNPFAANPFASPAPPPPPQPVVPVAIPPAAAPLTAPIPTSADPFGDSHFAVPSVPTPTVTVPPPPPPVDPPRPVGDVDAWFSALILKERGILYEDQYLQVGLQSQYTRGSGTVVLYLGNKHMAAQLTSVALVVAVSLPGVLVSIAPVPAVLEIKQQVQVPLAVVCLAPFTTPPVLSLSYAVGGAPALTGLQLRLPTAMHKFMTPEPHIPKEVFFEHWRHAPPQCKAQEMVDRGATGPLSSESVQSIMRLLHLGVEHGYLDPSPHNEAGSAYWSCGPAEAQRTAICCCRVEGNPQNRAQFRVTVVSEQPELATAVHSLLVAQIRAAPASH